MGPVPDPVELWDTVARRHDSVSWTWRRPSFPVPAYSRTPMRRALDLKVPSTLLAIADEVIE
jgi:hypothetical protein